MFFFYRKNKDNIFILNLLIVLLMEFSDIKQCGQMMPETVINFKLHCYEISLWIKKN